MSATSGAETVYPAGVPNSIPGIFCEASVVLLNL